IRGSAFEGCTGLTSIEIPDSVTEIGGYNEVAFYLGCDCKNYVFDGCTGLKSIILNITHNIPAESETFIKEALVEFRNSQVKLTVNIPIGTGYAYRHYPGFDQERLTFVPCNRHK
ncbi:MAG: leucine-rich repeat protein, partial [Candidatus Cryptobacteroides sp.]